ncbi:MAG: sulfite reductase flavoprotein subunit alpha [Opitutales bacterium]
MSTEIEKPVHDKNNPFPAQVSARYRLNPGNPLKETIHVEVDISGSGLTYACGDSLGVFPKNPPEQVEGVLKINGFTGEERVKLPKDATAISLREALSARLSLASPTKKTLQAFLERATYADETARLETLLADSNKDDLKPWLEQREFIDLAEEFPSVRFSAQEYVDLLRRLVPRLYSIASSPVLHPECVHLTIAVVRYRTNERARVGVASTYLSDRVDIAAPSVPVFVASSHFGLPPESGKDAIMVGPGTGIAPFRAFIQERAATGDSGRNWLFFGDQHQETDYLYGEEWQRYQDEGSLHRLSLAFSRDQAEKIYVQHRLLEAAEEVWQWLEGGAYFYVCGDAKRMAKDVDEAVHQICRDRGGMDETEAKDYVKGLKKEKRYQRDVY